MDKIVDGKIFFKKTNIALNGLDYVNTVGDDTFFKKFAKKCYQGLIVCNKCNKNIRATNPDTGIRFISHKGINGVENSCKNFSYATKSVKLAREAIYFGEGTHHEELKNELLNFLKKDKRLKEMIGETFLFHKTEKYSTGARKRRKPDISGQVYDKEMAIELQLSYQLDIDYFDRETFYETNNTFLMWFLYNVNRSDFTNAQKIIFYNNGENAYVITEETRKKSKEENKLFFWCYYTSFENGQVITQQKMITFDDITFDTHKLKLFYTDTTIERSMYTRLKLQDKILKEMDGEDKYVNFSDFLLHEINSLSIHKIKKPYYSFITLLWTIFSLKKGKIIGYKFKNFIGLLNSRFEYDKEFGDLIIKAIIVYRRGEEIKKHEKFSPSLEKKIKNYTTEKKIGKIIQEVKYNTIIFALFPELQ